MGVIGQKTMGQHKFCSKRNEKDARYLILCCLKTTFSFHFMKIDKLMTCYFHGSCQCC